MNEFSNQTYLTWGALFLILMIVGIYLYVTGGDSFQSTTVTTQNSSSSLPASVAQGSAEASKVTEASAPTGFELTSAQVEALVSLGIAPANVPPTISAEQEACFGGALGEGRVAEIKAGAVPSTFEFLKAEWCF